jgi:glycosyltransferase involved in cell wall biosynthesis
MRICLLGDFSGTPDEGMKNVSRTTYEFLSVKNEVINITARDMVKPSVILRLRKFNPQIIHYLHGPTIRSLVLLKIIGSIFCRNAGIVVSATRPYFSKFTRFLIPYLKPDLALTQSMKFEAFFKHHGWRVAFYPNGVDCNKFAPVDGTAKKHLREKYGLPLDKKIILHVGHLKQNRKLDLFMDLQKIEALQVVIVGGTVEKSDEALKETLKSSGVRVIHKFIKDISEIYKTADLYLFPILDKTDKLPDTYNQIGAIDLPLSILEAMACNLPVITTPFGALPRLFKQKEGFEYIRSPDDMVKRINTFSFSGKVRTRKMVLPLDWVNIIADLEKKYTSVMKTSDTNHHLGYKKIRPEDIKPAKPL